jgi:hypothetical protein
VTVVPSRHSWAQFRGRLAGDRHEGTHTARSQARRTGNEKRVTSGCGLRLVPDAMPSVLLQCAASLLLTVSLAWVPVQSASRLARRCIPPQLPIELR